MKAPAASESIPYRIEIEDGPVVRWDPRDSELLGLAASTAACTRLTPFDCRGLGVVRTEARGRSRDAG